ncbi:MAG: phage holin family protein [Candidatus Thermoplasmatota archaeon]|nr:phage holin family protein [Candidatus Thermoplasmatota archaeon]
MKGWAGFLLIGTGVFFILFSAIFFIAALAPPYDVSIIITAVVLLIIGFIPLGIFIYLKKNERPPEVRIEQNVNIGSDDLVSGKRRFKEMKCRSCSGPITSENVKLGDMGLSVICPYCGTTYSIEEDPIW